MATALGTAYDVSMAFGVLLLGIGFFWKDRRSHLARALGWSIFGVFWFLHVPDYVNQEDALNALGAAVALPIFLFVADRKSTRLNSSHGYISYAVFFLKKKKNIL